MESKIKQINTTENNKSTITEFMDQVALPTVEKILWAK